MGTFRQASVMQNGSFELQGQRMLHENRARLLFKIQKKAAKTLQLLIEKKEISAGAGLIEWEKQFSGM